MVLVGVAGMGGLTAWDSYQVRSAALIKDQRWVKRVSDMLSSERQSITQWIERFPVQTATFRDIANSRADVAALFLFDQKYVQTQRWVRRGLQEAIEPLDPRLRVLQLEALLIILKKILVFIVFIQTRI